MNNNLILFYLFSSFALTSAIMVISLSNAVHSVLFLILVFCNVASLLLLLGAEFLAFMLLIVYVGAIAVLFLFVVMMLNIKLSPIRISKFSIIPMGIIIFFILFIQIISGIDSTLLVSLSYYNYLNLEWVSWIEENNSYNNVVSVGNFLYTKFSILFLGCGLILLVAMIGAIVLTMHQRTNVKQQRIDLQLARNPQGVVKFVSLRH